MKRNELQDANQDFLPLMKLYKISDLKCQSPYATFFWFMNTRKKEFWSSLFPSWSVVKCCSYLADMDKSRLFWHLHLADSFLIDELIVCEIGLLVEKSFSCIFKRMFLSPSSSLVLENSAVWIFPLRGIRVVLGGGDEFKLQREILDVLLPMHIYAS